MIIATILFEDYANFVDAFCSKHVEIVVIRRKHYTDLKRVIGIFVIILSLFLFFLLFKYLNEKYLLFRTNIQNRLPDAKLILRQNKLDLKSRFMEIKSVNTKLGHGQTTKNLVAQVLLYITISKM